MPVNSFEDYALSWKPDKAELSSPISLCLADLMERDIRNGDLRAGTKMPPQRELADYLDLNLSTITKAYKLCEMRGLLQAVVGKGTFVSPRADMPASVVEKQYSAKIELGSYRFSKSHSQIICDVAAELLSRPSAEQLFESTYPFGSPRQLKAGISWLRYNGLEADAGNTMITSGVQNALAIILSALFEAGDWIAVSSYTYANFIGLANLLHLRLIPIENDEEGMRADLLESFCVTQKIKGIYLMPNSNNPTNVPCSAARRKELTELIERYRLIAIEDDNFAALNSKRLPPIAQEVPDRCIFISGMTKVLSQGLRIAYMYVPQQFHESLAQSLLNHNLVMPALNMEIAAELIESGRILQFIREKREFSVRRNLIYNEFFKSPYLETYCQWLPLPEHCSGRRCELELAQKGVHVLGAERFAVGSQTKCNAIRIATCSPKDEASLRAGLARIREFIEAENAAH